MTVFFFLAGLFEYRNGLVLGIDGGHEFTDVVIDQKVFEDRDYACLLVEQDVVDGFQIVVLLFNHELPCATHHQLMALFL